MKLKINNCGNFNKSHDNHIWYGGTVATIETDAGVFKLDANGEVRCNLYAKNDCVDTDGNEYKKGDIIANVIDKNNDGLFKKEIGHFVKDDEHLEKILNLEDENFDIELENCNWLELSFIDNEGNCQYSHILDTESIFEAIYEAMELVKNEQEKYIKSQDAIYTRSATFNNEAIEKQELMCINTMIKNKRDFEEIEIPVYSDNGFSSTNDYPPALKVLLEDIKNNKVKNVTVVSADRITRDISKVFEINELLNSNNSDIYLVRESSKLNEDFLNKMDIHRLTNIIEPLEQQIDELEMDKE